MRSTGNLPGSALGFPAIAEVHRSRLIACEREHSDEESGHRAAKMRCMTTPPSHTANAQPGKAPKDSGSNATPPSRRDGEQARQLLAAAGQHVLTHGFGDWSLRAIAPHLGTSHRMLIYYFGSADHFWERVLHEIRRDEVAKRREILGNDLGMAGNIERAWDRFSTESYLPVMQLLFELYGRAVRNPERHADFLQDVVASWLEPLERQMIHQLGLRPKEARLRARLQLATFRGLMLDLLATGDRKETTAALKYFAQLIAQPPHPD